MKVIIIQGTAPHFSLDKILQEGFFYSSSANQLYLPYDMVARYKLNYILYICI